MASTNLFVFIAKFPTYIYIVISIAILTNTIDAISMKPPPTHQGMKATAPPIAQIKPPSNGTNSTISKKNDIVFDCFSDVGFVIDESGSIDTQEWNAVLDFVRQIADTINIPEGRAAVVAFSSGSRHPITFADHQTLIGFENALRGIGKVDGGTNIGAALEEARDIMFQASNGMRTNANVGHFLLLITDGQDKGSDYIHWREEFARLDIIVIAIGVGDGVNMATLATLSPNNNYHAATFDDLLSPEFRAQIRLCRDPCILTCENMGGSTEVCKERCACASQCAKNHTIFEPEYWRCLGKCLMPQLPLRHFQQRLVRPPYKFAILGTTCENTKGYSGISSKSECQAAVKTQPKGSNFFIDDMSGKGHDLPKGCIADALSLNKESVWDPIIMIGNPKKAVYWNPEGVATSNDAKIREICAHNGPKDQPPHCFIDDDCEKPAICIRPGPPGMHGFCMQIKHWIPHCIEACKDVGGNEVGCKKSCECYGQCLKDGGTLDSCRPKCQHPEKMKDFRFYWCGNPGCGHCATSPQPFFCFASCCALMKAATSYCIPPFTCHKASCENSDGLTGFYYSHDGFWNGGATKEGYMTKVECARTCMGRASCVAINTYAYSFKGNCYHYSNRDDLVSSNEVIELSTKAYIKCLGSEPDASGASPHGYWTVYEEGLAPEKCKADVGARVDDSCCTNNPGGSSLEDLFADATCTPPIELGIHKNITVAAHLECHVGDTFTYAEGCYDEAAGVADCDNCRLPVVDISDYGCYKANDLPGQNWFVYVESCGPAEMLKICNKRVTEKYLKHASLKINPNPILLMGGAMISISGGLELLKDIPVASKVKLKLNNHFGDEFPCIDPEAYGLELPLKINVGSCKYDIQKDIFDNLKKVIPNCALPSVGCNLPIKSGRFGLGDIAFRLPNFEMPELFLIGFQDWFGKPLKLEVKFLGKNEEEIICLDATLQINVE